MTWPRARCPPIPDGYPLSYKGSRDNNFYIAATDRGDQPEVLWKLNAYENGVTKVWNDDWDGAGLIVDDYLFEGGENSWFYIVKLNRGYDAAGKVTVDPQDRLQDPRLGRPAQQGPPRPPLLHRELGRHLRATPCTSPTPPGWCRAGTSPG